MMNKKNIKSALAIAMMWTGGLIIIVCGLRLRLGGELVFGGLLSAGGLLWAHKLGKEYQKEEP